MQEPAVDVVKLVVRRALMLWVLAMLGSLAVGIRAAGGVAFGGGISVGTLVLYRALVRSWVRPDRWRRGRIVLIGVWLVKWPAIAGLLYLATHYCGASPLWLCAGVGLVPAVVTAVAAWTALTPDWEQKIALELR